MGFHSAMKKNRIHVVLDTSQSIRQEDSLVSKESLSSGLKHPSKNLSAPENSVLGVVGCSGQRQGDPCNLLINHYSPSASSRLHGRDVCMSVGMHVPQNTPTKVQGQLQRSVLSFSRVEPGIKLGLSFRGNSFIYFVI